MNKLKSIIAGILAVFLWAAIPAFVKVGTTEQNLSYLLVLRFMLASLLFLPVVGRILKKATKIPARQWGLLTIVLGMNYYFQGLAMHGVPASWYVVIFSLNPIIALALLKIPISKKKLLGLLLAFSGTLLFVSSEFGHAPILAIFYIFIGMLTWVVYTKFIQNFQKVYTDIESSALTQFVSLFASLLIWAWQSCPTQSLNSLEMSSMLALGTTTPVAYFCFSYCMRRTPSFGIVSQYLEPVFGVVIGVTLFHETLTTAQLLGAAAIVFGAIRTEAQG